MYDIAPQLTRYDMALGLSQLAAPKDNQDAIPQPNTAILAELLVPLTGHQFVQAVCPHFGYQLEAGRFVQAF